MERFAIFLVLILFSCSGTGDTPELVPIGADHIEFFGFTLIDTFWDDPTDTDSKTNFSDEVSPFSNVADILVIAPKDNIVPRMQGMQQVGMKSMLHVAELFFE